MERALVPAPGAWDGGPALRGSFLAIASMLLFISCGTTPNHVAARLPADVSFRYSPARGETIALNISLSDGQPIPVLLDTGADGILLDQSIEPQLGSRWATGNGYFPAYGATTDAVYKAPKLYLNGTRLETGEWVNTTDFSKLPFASRRVRGLLGMQCLRHYCLQLDFQAGKLRFLDSKTLDPAKLGRAFPITVPTHIPRVYVKDNFAGVEGEQSIVDTGDSWDGALLPKNLRTAVANRDAAVMDTRQAGKGAAFADAYFPKVVFGGETYRDLKIHESTAANMIGLRFLSRHLVTFDFPHNVMYLKRVDRGK